MTSFADRVTPRQRVFLTASAMIASIMMALDSTIANVALPEIQGGFGASQEQIAWVLTSYLVSSAIATPLAGALVPRLGFRRVYVLCIFGFLGSSLLCGFATSLPQLVLFRFLQGFTGAGFFPLSQALMLDIYPRERHGQAMAVFGTGVMVGPTVGPVLGGFITDAFGWRWIFLINVPFGLVALAGMMIFLPKVERDRATPFDFLGFGLLSIAIACLQLVLDRGEAKDWFASTEIIIEATLAGLCGYLFLVHVLTARHPFLDPAVFRDRNFSAGVLVILVLGMLMLSAVFVIPPYLQHLRGYTVFDTGLILAPRGIAMMAGMFLTGRLITRFDPRAILLTGTLINLLALYEMRHFTLETPISTVVWTGMLQSFGLGLLFVPVNVMTFATLSATLRPVGTSLYHLTRGVGNSLGVALVVGVITRGTDNNLMSIADHITPFNPLLSSGALPPEFTMTDTMSIKLMQLEIIRQAAMIAYNNAFILQILISLLILPLLLIQRPPPRVASAQASAASGDVAHA